MENHIDNISYKVSKCVGILCKASKELPKPYLINLYDSFAYPYMICYNHVLGSNYPSNLEKMKKSKKSLYV